MHDLFLQGIIRGQKVIAVLSGSVNV